MGSQFFWKQIFCGGNFGDKVLEKKRSFARNNLGIDFSLRTWTADNFGCKYLEKIVGENSFGFWRTI